MGSVLKRLSALFLRPELVFLSLAIPFGILSAIMVPQLSVADENMHFLKAYNLASGSLGTQNCIYPSAVAHKVHSIYVGDFTADFKNDIDESSKAPGRCGPAASYTPIMHFPQAIGIFIAKLIDPTTGLMTLFARLANLAFFVAAVYYIIKKVRIGKWVFAVIALFPLTIHLAASVSADAMNTVIVFSFVALIFNLFVQKEKISKRQIIVLLALTCLLALTKAPNTMLLFPLLLLPARLFDGNKWQLPFNLQKWSVAALCGALAVLCIVGWQHIYGAPLVTPTENALTNNPLYFLVIVYNTYINPFLGYTDLLFRGLVGDFASFKYHLPTYLVFLCLLVLSLALLHKDKKEEEAVRSVSVPLMIGSSVALALLVAAVTYALYTVWSTLPRRLGPDAIYADGVQGRYFTAALVLLVPVFLWLRQFVRFETKSSQTIGIIVFSSAALWLLFYTIETYRFIV